MLLFIRDDETKKKSDLRIGRFCCELSIARKQQLVMALLVYWFG